MDVNQGVRRNLLIGLRCESPCFTAAQSNAHNHTHGEQARYTTHTCGSVICGRVVPPTWAVSVFKCTPVNLFLHKFMAGVRSVDFVCTKGQVIAVEKLHRGLNRVQSTMQRTHDHPHRELRRQLQHDAGAWASAGPRATIRSRVMDHAPCPESSTCL